MFSCIFQSLPYTRWDTVFYADYEMGGKAPTTLKTYTNVEVFEELGGCYLVMADGKPGFVAKPQVSKWSIKSSSGSNGDDSSSRQDGGDISLGVRREDSSAFRCCQYRQCTGSRGWCQRGIKIFQSGRNRADCCRGRFCPGTGGLHDDSG